MGASQHTISTHLILLSSMQPFNVGFFWKNVIITLFAYMGIIKIIVMRETQQIVKFLKIIKSSKSISQMLTYPRTALRILQVLGVQYKKPLLVVTWWCSFLLLRLFNHSALQNHPGEHGNSYEHQREKHWQLLSLVARVRERGWATGSDIRKKKKDYNLIKVKELPA